VIEPRHQSGCEHLTGVNLIGRHHTTVTWQQRLRFFGWPDGPSADA
jgi:hypothetical protein